MLKQKFILTVLICITSQAGFGASSKVRVGDVFPVFSMKALGGSKSIALTQSKGKVVVVDFWASWCEPCKKEIPALNALFKKYRSKGLVVLGVNEDDEEGTAKDFIKDNHVDFQLLHDEEKKLAGLCDLQTMPSSFVLDKTGKVKFIHVGYRDGDPEKFESEIKKLL